MRLVIADDEMLMREGLARLLGDAGFDVVGRAADGPELLRAVPGSPDSHRRVLAVLAFLRS